MHQFCRFFLLSDLNEERGPLEDKSVTIDPVMTGIHQWHTYVGCGSL